MIGFGHGRNVGQIGDPRQLFMAFASHRAGMSERVFAYLHRKDAALFR